MGLGNYNGNAGYANDTHLASGIKSSLPPDGSVVQLFELNGSHLAFQVCMQAGQTTKSNY